MSKAFEEAQKKLYKTFQPVFCPALNEMVYFNADGFSHLLFENRRPRNANERVYRTSLLPYVHSVISNAPTAKEHIKSTTPPVTTWGLDYKLIKTGTNGKLCKVTVVVIRKKPKGQLTFLSVMCQRKCRPRKKFLGII
jgi:hypothetical protein